MHVIHARNVSEALPLGLQYLKDYGQEEPSRNGSVLASSVPVTTVYAFPKQHVLFSPERNANPFFHLFEALWMLGGRNDVAFPARYAAQLQLYSDDNVTLNGAYGFRWREHFGYDQLDLIIQELKNNPASRRCVLGMWDAMDGSEARYAREHGGYEGDLQRAISGGKDVPCNTHVYFRLNQGQLDMTVCNRSNDVVWGAYGANAVHFSLLMEYVAQSVGIAMGRYYQIANNFHAYKGREDVQRLMSTGMGAAPSRYSSTTKNKEGAVVTCPLFGNEDKLSFDKELEMWLENPSSSRTYNSSLLKVAQLMAQAHVKYKANELKEAISLLRFSHVDWIVAGREWLERVQETRALKGRL